MANNETPFSRSDATRSAASLVGIVAAVGDPEGTRTITSIVALLAALGVALVMLAVWLFKTTRPDPELLAPLEVMGERRWRRGDAVWQRRRLDEIRPSEAMPLARSSAPPVLDASFDAGPSALGFDDLHGAGLDDEVEPSPVVSDLSPPSTVPAEGDDRQRATFNSDTPYETIRPPVDELPEGEVDPELLATAMAELDAEMRRPPN